MPKNIAKGMPGFYSPGEAMKQLGITNRDFFKAIVKKYKEQGRLKSVRPAGVNMYPEAQIKAIGDELQLILMQALDKENREPLEFGPAKPEEAQAVSNVLHSLGWRSASAEQRQARYKINPTIDFVVRQAGFVVGFASITPYRPEVMEQLLAGRIGGWDVKPEDIYPYEKGKKYQVYVGLAVHKEAPDAARVGRRLILGLRDILNEWRAQGILITQLWGVSAEEDGIRTADYLGFEPQPAKEGDKVGWIRYMLDLEHDPHPLATRRRRRRKQHPTSS